MLLPHVYLFCREDKGGVRHLRTSDQLRRQALDGPLSVEESSRGLLAASLAAAKIESDQQGSLRLIKSSRTNCGRDDAVVSWVLAAGARDRVPVVRGGLTRSLLV